MNWKTYIETNDNIFLPDEPAEYLIESFQSKVIQFEDMLTVIGRENI